ncbi:MAG TPA: hypothetical protein VF765_14215 [Polyangiaceae bacterium]
MARGSLLGLGIGSAVLVLALVIGGVLLLRRCSSGSAGDATAAAPDRGATAASEGMNAKGTAEMRQLGCEQALVVDMARVLGGASHIEAGEPRWMVTCDVGSASPPACERVAATYFGAVGTPDGNVCVRVSRTGAAQPSCSRLYAPNGADLGTFPRAR